MAVLSVRNTQVSEEQEKESVAPKEREKSGVAGAESSALLAPRIPLVSGFIFFGKRGRQVAGPPASTCCQPTSL